MRPLLLLISYVLLVQVSHAATPNISLKKPSVVVQVRKLDKPAPTVLISHGSACLVQQSYDWASQINKWGYNAVVIDHCSSRGVSRYTQSGKGPPDNLMPKDKAGDYLAIGGWLQGEEWHKGKTAVIGFSMGGTGVLKLVGDTPEQHNLSTKGKRLIDAVVAFYPECNRNRPTTTPTLPTLVHHGLSDELALAMRCKYSELVHPNYQIKLYEGAHHTFDDNASVITGFNQKGESKVLRRYNADADNISRMTTKAFLDQHLRTSGD